VAQSGRRAHAQQSCVDNIGIWATLLPACQQKNSLSDDRLQLAKRNSFRAPIGFGILLHPQALEPIGILKALSFVNHTLWFEQDQR